MVSLPITCTSCGRKRFNYGSCTCPDGQLFDIDQERAALKRRLERLDAKEREVLGLRGDGETQIIAKETNR